MDYKDFENNKDPTNGELMAAILGLSGTVAALLNAQTRIIAFLEKEDPSQVQRAYIDLAERERLRLLASFLLNRDD